MATKWDKPSLFHQFTIFPPSSFSISRRESPIAPLPSHDRLSKDLLRDGALFFIIVCSSTPIQSGDLCSKVSITA
jgi:hypothetical protein